MKRVLYFSAALSIFLFLWAVLPSGDVRGDEGIVGAEICKGCHEDRYNSYAKSIHANKYLPNSPANRDACESCHGAGAAHVEKSGEKGVGIFIFGKRLAEAREKSAKCLACHGDHSELALWDMSKHQSVSVSCDNCQY